MKSILSIILGYILKFFLFILRPFIRIRIGLVPYRSLGRISGNMEYYFRNQISENNSRKEHFSEDEGEQVGCAQQ